jgi:hypothetical protein
VVESRFCIGDEVPLTRCRGPRSLCHDLDRAALRHLDEREVADPIAPVVVELAIAFGDCDRPPTKR